MMSHYRCSYKLVFGIVCQITSAYFRTNTFLELSPSQNVSLKQLESWLAPTACVNPAAWPDILRGASPRLQLAIRRPWCFGKFARFLWTRFKTGTLKLIWTCNCDITIDSKYAFDDAWPPWLQRPTVNQPNSSTSYQAPQTTQHTKLVLNNKRWGLCHGLTGTAHNWAPQRGHAPLNPKP